jgi:hypothetical protein
VGVFGFFVRSFFGGRVLERRRCFAHTFASLAVQSVYPNRTIAATLDV